MKVLYITIPESETYWCNSHRRRARKLCIKFGEFPPQAEVCCEGPGIMLPCRCVRLTGIAEIEET